MLQKDGHIKNTVVFTILTFQHIQCLHLIYAEEAWVLVASGTHVQPQVMLDADYLPDYLSISYDYVKTNKQEEKARLTQKHTTTIGPKNQTQQP